MLCDLAADLFDVRQIGLASIARRSSNGDKNDFGERGSFLNGRRKFQPAGGDITVNYFFEPRLVNGHFSAFQDLDLVLVIIHAQHVVADLCKTGACHQADVSGSNNRDFHAVKAPPILKR